MSRVYSAVGRRKSSVAVAVLRDGVGREGLRVNGKPLEKYFTRKELQEEMLKPLKIAQEKYAEGELAISITVKGGGQRGQSGASKLAIARVLCEVDPSLRTTLRDSGCLTRDSRSKERKKYGLKKARKAPQFSKR
ncbi:30S ribosomal protein S9 [bacterium]|jgi:small subunit ribosomal protein S9|nr:30S ribosomal protein S9 [bacterium]|tara:strand:+ start:290 stop:694 length:405 start_codon:yes stop_codon:yes gene_type:complete